MTDAERQQVLDAEHLRLLRFGYLISGFTNVLFALFPLIHVTFGLAMLFGVFPGTQTKGEPFPRSAGLLLVVLGGAISLSFAIVAILKLAAARRLRERRAKTFCMVTAGVACLGVPYGTALGVATFMLLARPSVAALFDPAPGKTTAGSPD